MVAAGTAGSTVERMIKERPHRLDLIYINQPLYFVTFATRDRRSIPSLDGAQLALQQYARCAIVKFNVALGRYVIMMGSQGTDALNPAMTYHWTQLQNIMRDPFENNVGADQKGALSIGGALAAPSTAYLYDWNLLPIGQLLWLKELTSYVDYPPLQLAASYNLQQVLDQVQQMTKDHPSQ